MKGLKVSYNFSVTVKKPNVSQNVTQYLSHITKDNLKFIRHEFSSCSFIKTRIFSKLQNCVALVNIPS